MIDTAIIEKRAGVYVLRNKINGKVYVGSAVNLHKRALYHTQDLRQKRHPSRKLQNAWNKYGEDAFEFSVIVFVDDPNNLVPTEQRFIELFDAVKKGYNSSPVAGSQLGFKHSEETKQRIAAAQQSAEAKERWLEWSRDKNPKPPKPVICNETGERFPSIQAASAAMGLTRSSVGRNAQGKRKTVGGYTFTYAS